MDRATADYMGMLATVMNALALQDALQPRGCRSHGCSPHSTSTSVAEPISYATPPCAIWKKARVVIFGGGTGNPFFTTDTAAALRGTEMGADIVLKATKVDGVYTADPKKDPAATRYEPLSFDEAIARNLQVIDATAFALCRDKTAARRVQRFQAGRTEARGDGRGRRHAGDANH